MELYRDDLITLANLLGNVEDIANTAGVFGVEIYVKFDDTDTWAVLGYGESGDPCLTGFAESVEEVVSVPVKPYTPLPIPFLINKAVEAPLKDYDSRF